MHSKYIQSFLRAALLPTLVGLSACSLRGPLTGERVIGSPLQPVTTPDHDNGSNSRLALFDTKSQMIHEFNLSTMTYERALPVQDSTLQHNLLLNQEGDYLVDLTKKHLSVFSPSGVENRNVLAYVGMPVSAAFRPSLGDLAVYTDTNSVGLVKLSPTGGVLNAASLGPVIGGNSDLTVVAGDIDDTGELVLALSDNSIAAMDFDQSLAQQSWVANTHFATGLQGITWLAPVHGATNLVLVNAKGQFAIFNVANQSLVSTYTLSSGDYVVALSKSVDPHFLLSNYAGDQLKIGTVSSGEIHVFALNQTVGPIEDSRLDLQNNSWSLLLKSSGARQLKRYRFSDLLALGDKTLPKEPQVQLLESSVFALFPSDLGYAVNYDSDDDGKNEFKLFNVGHLRRASN